MMLCTYSGLSLFGQAVRCKMMQAPSAAQINEFFGVNGKSQLYGGSRGRIFAIDGVLWSGDGPVGTQLALLLSFDDGVGRVFYHDLWGSWPGVVFRQYEPARILPDSSLIYKAAFEGLS